MHEKETKYEITDKNSEIDTQKNYEMKTMEFNVLIMFFYSH